MSNHNGAVITALLSLGVVTATYLYDQYKKGNIKLTLDRGFLKINGRIKGQPLCLSIPLPDLSNAFNALGEFNDKYLKS